MRVTVSASQKAIHLVARRTIAAPHRRILCGNISRFTTWTGETTESRRGAATTYVAAAPSSSDPAARQRSGALHTNLYGDRPNSSDVVAGSVSTSVLQDGYDLVVIGGGPSGVSAGFQAALMGHSALIVDRPKSQPNNRGVDVSFGGPTGLFSKALRDAAKRLDVTALRAQGFDDDVIWKQITNQCLKLSTRNAEAVVDTLKKHHVHYHQGVARLKQSTDGMAVEITPCDTLVAEEGKEETRVVTVPAGHVLLATGSRPFRVDSIPFDGVRVFDSDTINTLSFLPKSVAIAGGGIIAIEYARIFRRLGADVTLIIREESAVYALDRMGMDKDIARRLVHSMIQEGITVHSNAVIDQFTQVPRHQEETVEMTLVSSTNSSKAVYGGTLKADIYLAAIGRIPTFNLTHSQVESLGLDETGIDWDIHDGIAVNRKTYQTSNPMVYATGDVIGRPALASTGAEQAKIAVENMLDPEKAKERKDNDISPIGIWTIPEIGYYGYTREKAEEEGIDVEVGEATYENCLRGRVFAPEGLLKLVFEKHSGAVVGCHIIGEDACELIHFGKSLVRMRVPIFDLCNEIFTAVTFHELFKEAALDGDAKLNFGAAWHCIFDALSDGLAVEEMPTPQELRRVFDGIDRSNTGDLTVEDLSQMFRELGSNVNRQYIEKLIRIADLDGSGGIDFEEFEKIFQGLASRMRSGEIYCQHRSNISHHLERNQAVPK